MGGYAFDVSHFLAGSMVAVSFMLLYQRRIGGVLGTISLHAIILAAAVSWQAHVNAAPHLYLTAALALGFKGILLPLALAAIIRRLAIHREVETVIGIGPTLASSRSRTASSWLPPAPRACRLWSRSASPSRC
jgi:hydrogenase-4 component E